MSTAALPGLPNHPVPREIQGSTGRLLAFPDHTAAHTIPTAAPVRAACVRRRGSLAQGRALETLGHAVEYLIDCGMFQQERYDPKANHAAVQILMRASRRVFEECPEVLPLSRRLGLWSRRVVARARRKASPPAC